MVEFFSKKMNQEKLILFAEDNVSDRFDIARIFDESEAYAKLRFVEDGSDLLMHLFEENTLDVLGLTQEGVESVMSELADIVVAVEAVQ